MLMMLLRVLGKALGLKRLEKEKERKKKRLERLEKVGKREKDRPFDGNGRHQRKEHRESPRDQGPGPTSFQSRADSRRSFAC